MPATLGLGSLGVAALLVAACGGGGGTSPSTTKTEPQTETKAAGATAPAGKTDTKTDAKAASGSGKATGEPLKIGQFIDRSGATANVGTKLGDAIWFGSRTGSKDRRPSLKAAAKEQRAISRWADCKFSRAG